MAWQKEYRHCPYCNTVTLQLRLCDGSYKCTICKGIIDEDGTPITPYSVVAKRMGWE